MLLLVMRLGASMLLLTIFTTTMQHATARLTSEQATHIQICELFFVLLFLGYLHFDHQA